MYGENAELEYGGDSSLENCRGMPWDKYEKEFTLDSVHESKILEIVDKGATIRLNDDITAFIPSRLLEKNDGSRLVKDEKAQFKIIEFNKEFKRVVASHTGTFKTKDKNKLIKKSKSNISTTKEKSTLGDIDALAELKKKMR